MTQRSAFAHRRLRTRKGLRISCASAALAAAALAPQSAHAQALGAFRGTVTGTTGTVTRNPVSNTAETITVGSSTATINWSPSGQQQGGGTLDFLPSGNTATFTSAQGITDYTVLNRIVPDSGQPIALNGHVVSTLQGTSTTGGNVWFYSPNGIVVGSSAVFRWTCVRSPSRSHLIPVSRIATTVSGRPRSSFQAPAALKPEIIGWVACGPSR